MSENDNGSTDEATLSDQPYGDLMNAARSAREQFEEVNIETNAPTKDELVQTMKQYGFEGSREEGFTVMIEDEQEEVELLDVQTPDESSGSSGPSDETVLYCLTRAATTPNRVESISEALESETDFELREAGEGDKYAIVLPAENQEGYEEVDEDAEDEESGDGDESEEQAADEDSAEGDDEDTEEDEESKSEESDGSDGEDDGASISADVYRGRLEEKTYDELYEAAQEVDLTGRTDMDKDELIEGVLEARIEDDESPVEA